MTSTREVTESPVYQGSDEIVAYVFNMATIGAVWTGPYARLFDRQTGGSIGSSSFGGTATASGADLTASTITGIAAGQRWRLTVGGTVSSNKLSAFVDIIGE